MPRPRLELPDIDWCDNVLFRVPIALVPIVGGLLEYLEWPASWVLDSQQSGYQAAVRLQERLIVGECEETIYEGLQDIAEALQCICGRLAGLPQGEVGNQYSRIIDAAESDGGIVLYHYGAYSPVVDEERCAVANLTWAMAYQCLTQYLMPIQDAALDALLPAALGALGFALAGPPGILLAALSAVVGAYVDVWAEGQQQAVANSLFSHRDELVCAVYTGLGIGYDAAHQNVLAILADIEELSPIDKLFLGHFFSPSWVDRMREAYRLETEWALANEEGVDCGECDWIAGSDWIAVPWGQSVYLDHSEPGEYWAEAGLEYSILEGLTLAGVIFSCVLWSGECTECQGITTPDPGSTFWNLTPYIEGLGSFFVYKQFAFDTEECAAVLCPDAIEGYQVDTTLEGPQDIEFWFKLGWDCSGAAELRIDYLVFLKPD